MGTKYSSTSPSGYNSSPPSDDGSATEANRVYWATGKTKLADPLYNWISAVNTALVTFADVGPSAQASAYTTVVGDHLKTVEVTGTTTITLGAVASMGAGYIVTILNNGSGTVTVDGSGAETINGVASFTLPANGSVTVQVDSTATNYYILHYGSLSSTVATLGTAEASKVVTTDASKNIGGLNQVTSTTFVGALTGNASTATSATSATTAGSITGQGALATLNTVADAQITDMAVTKLTGSQSLVSTGSIASAGTLQLSGAHITGIRLNSNSTGVLIQVHISGVWTTVFNFGDALTAGSTLDYICPMSFSSSTGSEVRINNGSGVSVSGTYVSYS